MNELLAALLILAMVATLGVLFAGLVVMARGGDVSKKYSNILMRWRVILQFSAVAVIVLIVLAAAN